MSIDVTCGGCGKLLHVPEKAAGRKGKCPHCGAVVQVPPLDAPPIIEAALVGEPSVEEPSPARAAAADAKDCPYCGERIKSAAIVCRFCGMHLVTGETTRGPSAPPRVIDARASEPESILWQGSPTNWAYAAHYILAILLIPFVIGIPILIWVILDRRCTVYTVSNKRVVQKRGIIGKALSEVDLKDIRNVVLQYGVLGRLLGFGNLGLATAGTGGIEILMRGCKNPDYVRSLVVEAKERAQHGVYRVE